MQVQNKKKKNQPWKSLYLSCRRHLPCCTSSSISSNNDKNLPVINPIPLPKSPPLLANSQHNMKRSSHFSQTETAQLYWQRVSELEKELAELEEWLHTELAQLRSHFRSNFSHDRNNHGTFCVNKNGNFNGRLERLEGDDEGYLYYLLKGMMLVNGTSQDLPIQFYPPILLPSDQFGSNIFEILNQIEKIGMENLITWLLESSPITHISTSSNEPDGRTTTPFSRAPKDIEGASVLKLGELVVEGLQIQMGVKEAETKQQWRRENGSEGKFDDHSREGRYGGVVIMAMLIKPREPQKGQQVVVNNNQVMVGFVEVENSEENGAVIKGVHVVGFMARTRYGNGDAMHSSMWCVSKPS